MLRKLSSFDRKIEKILNGLEKEIIVKEIEAMGIKYSILIKVNYLKIRTLVSILLILDV